MSQARTKQLKSSIQVMNRDDSYLTEGEGDREIFGLIFIYLSLFFTWVIEREIFHRSHRAIPN